MSFKVLTAEFQHETNTFNRRPTDIQAFRDRFVLFGDEAIAKRGSVNTEIAGFPDGGRAHDWQIEHVISAAAGPSGKVTREAFDLFASPVVAAAKGKNFDGILLGLHGAMVTDFCEDGEGELLARLRQAVGPELPIAVTLDPHGNVTMQMCELANILVAFTTYPHIDMREISKQAGNILHRTMSCEIKPRTIRAHRPMLEEANGGRTDAGPMIERIRAARAYEERVDVFAVSVNGALPQADIAEVGPTVLVCGEGDFANHVAFAESIADDIWDRRDELLNDFLSVEEAACIAASCQSTGGPLIIADYADNPGGGAYGDSTNLLQELLTADVNDACFGPMVDSAVVQQLHGAGIGNIVPVELGGKTDAAFGGCPLRLDARLLAFSDGRFTGDGITRLFRPRWRCESGRY